MRACENICDGCNEVIGADDLASTPPAMDVASVFVPGAGPLIVICTGASTALVYADTIVLHRAFRRERARKRGNWLLPCYDACGSWVLILGCMIVLQR